MGVGQFPITALPDAMVPKRTAVQVLEFHSANHRGESYLLQSLRSDTPEHFWATHYRISYTLGRALGLDRGLILLCRKPPNGIIAGAVESISASL